MDYLTQLQQEYKELSDSITPYNTDEHESIVRQMEANVDAQERYLARYDY
jgi:hypothetical protein